MFSTNNTLHNYRFTGQFGFDIMKIPVIVEGLYNSFQSYSGINSYFTNRQDAVEYANRKKLLKSKLVDSLKQNQLKVYKRILEVEGKVSFLKNLEPNLKQGSDRKLKRDFIGNRYGKANISLDSLNPPSENVERDGFGFEGDSARTDFQEKLNSSGENWKCLEI